MGEECSMTDRREEVGTASVCKADKDEAGPSSVIPDNQTDSLRPISDSSTQLLLYDGQVPDALELELWNKTIITTVTILFK